MKMRANYVTTIFTGIAIAFSSPVLAQDVEPKQTLFTNVQIFDGVREERMAGNVLVEGNLIKQVSATAINAPGATVIDGGGGTLMPGLIDMHSHLSIMEGMLEGRAGFDQMAMGAMTGNVMRSYLDQGGSLPLWISVAMCSALPRPLTWAGSQAPGYSHRAGFSPKRVAMVIPGALTMSWMRPIR